MVQLSLITTVSVTGFSIFATAQTILVDTTVPDGYQVGLATQDYEPQGQQSICTTNCQLANPFTSTWGPTPLPLGVFAAAINPTLGGAAEDCAPCGSCYSIVNSGNPYCDPNNVAACSPAAQAYTGDAAQQGPTSIKILITNHYPNCDDIPGHFDINQEPNKVGWNNPAIFWKKLDDEECL